VNIYMCLFACCGRCVLLVDGVNELENEDVRGEYLSLTPMIRTASRSLPRMPTEASLAAYSPLMRVNPIFKQNLSKPF
jgi:hypothetical protein